ncbi:hypothetical protein JI666_06480 [Bacillus sp. NTK071]|uniref:hypothetical protein n=1 Tax=Bacillus sp. NTK071 TaxID=2802175 RepID=UPI001A8D6D90|nr:hypothetical protein [Bacillus sp. NTK071]MBN8208384.1 hypothetical protein [Bacillus sp. NTK071]
MKVIKTYYPKVKAIELFMSLVYGIVVSFGTLLLWLKGDLSFERWRSFMLIGLIYVLFCALLSFCIRTQRIELTEYGIEHKLLGIRRRSVAFTSMKTVTFGKVNGSPVVAIENKYNKKTIFVPYIPFEQDWGEINTQIKKRNGTVIITI